MKSAAEEGTKKLYLDNYALYECEAEVTEVMDSEDGQSLQLDRTCFYPGGGGQPCDVGNITWSGGSMAVSKVQKDAEGIVWHIGSVSGSLTARGEAVRCVVDSDIRLYHSRLHSAGHLIDLAVTRAGYDWAPGRGAHFPDMSFVEYTGEFDATQMDEYRENIQKEIDAIITSGGKIKSSRLSSDEARIRSKYLPEAVLAKYEQVHVATYDGSFDICCGGTHVQDASDIGMVAITKVKKKDKAIRVSYSLQ